MGSGESSQNSGSEKSQTCVQGQDQVKKGDVATVVGVAVAAVSVIGGLLCLFGGSSSTNGGKTMKAPGRDSRIFRKDFERDPATYFRGLRK